MLFNAWRIYESHVLVKNPFKTKMATSFVLYSLGDITCQFAFEKQKKWDWGRTVR